MVAERKEFDSIQYSIADLTSQKFAACHFTAAKEIKSLRCNLAAPNPLHAPLIPGVPNRCVHHWHLVFAGSQIVVDQTRPEIVANNLKQTFDLLYQLYHGWSLGFLCISLLFLLHIEGTPIVASSLSAKETPNPAVIQLTQLRPTSVSKTWCLFA